MVSSRHTILGAQGFIGTALRAALAGEDLPDFSAFRGTALLERLRGEPLGTVYYCIGMTANFRQQPFATVDANLLLLRDILEHCDFGQLVYLSSTRVYAGSQLATEDQPLLVRADDADQLYNLSKLLAENLCASSGRHTRVVRLSNVYGKGMRPWNFLASVLHDAAQTGEVEFRTAPASEKDYICVDDVAQYIVRIARSSVHRVYNIASGENISNGEIAALLERQGIRTHFADNAPLSVFPIMDAGRLHYEFGPPQHRLQQDIPELLEQMKTSCFKKSESTI